jgi:hypothetical protein
MGTETGCFSWKLIQRFSKTVREHFSSLICTSDGHSWLDVTRPNAYKNLRLIPGGRMAASSQQDSQILRPRDT